MDISKLTKQPAGSTPHTKEDAPPALVSKILSVFQGFEPRGIQDIDKNVVSKLPNNRLARLSDLVEKTNYFPRLTKAIKECRSTINSGMNGGGKALSAFLRGKVFAYGEKTISQMAEIIEKHIQTGDFDDWSAEDFTYPDTCFTRWLAASRLPAIVNDMDFEARFSPNLKFKASQHDYLFATKSEIQGVCFSSAIKASHYFANHRNTMSFEGWMRKQGDDKIKAPEGRLFSATDIKVQKGYGDHLKRTGKEGVLGPEGQRLYGTLSVQIHHTTDSLKIKPGRAAWETFAKIIVDSLHEHHTLVMGMRPRSGSGHAIEVDYFDGTYGVWDASNGRLEFRDQKVFKHALVGLMEYRTDILDLLKYSSKPVAR